MESWQAAVLGLVEGLTEYLPISSTGHLLLTQRVLGITQSAASDAFAVAIQLGAILAVLAVYGSRIRQMLAGVVGRDREGRNLALCVVVAFIPAATIGLLSGGAIKEFLFNLHVVAASWVAWGIAILIIFIKPRFSGTSIGEPLERLTWRGGLVIGLFQTLALIPGTSRSLVTIIGALVVGMSLPSAVEFSFLLGVVTLGAATCYDLVFNWSVMYSDIGLNSMLIGLFVSFVSGISAVKWMVTYLSRHGMSLFGWYRIGIAIVTVILLVTGIISK